MLQLLLIAPSLAAAIVPTKSPVRLSAKIVHGEEASEEAWLKSHSRTKRTIVDEQGRRLVIRLIEYE